MECLREGQFTPFVPLLPLPQTRNRCFGWRAFTPLIPLCPPPKTEKQNQILFKSNFFQKLKENMYII